MKSRPILFSGEMVRALLAGIKTQTRRYAKGQRELSCIHDFQLDRCPYGQVGEHLIVKETYRFGSGYDGIPPRDVVKTPHAIVQYMADGMKASKSGGECHPSTAFTPGKTRVSIHMPLVISRITLEITAVRVQRLQDISDDDAYAEGVDGGCVNCGNPSRGNGCCCPDPCPLPRDSYLHLWESLNGAGSWTLNPWVWALTFKRVLP